MTRQELEHQLLNLSLADKAEIIQSLTKNLSKSGKGITKTPGIKSLPKSSANLQTYNIPLKSWLKQWR